MEGGVHPRWSHKGDELFYVESNKLMAVSVRSSASFEPDAPRALFSGDGVTPRLLMNAYDVSRDGRFVMVQQLEAGVPSKPVITLVQDWVKEFEERQ